MRFNQIVVFSLDRDRFCSIEPCQYHASNQNGKDGFINREGILIIFLKLFPILNNI